MMKPISSQPPLPLPPAQSDLQGTTSWAGALTRQLYTYLANMVYRLNHTFTDDNAALAGIADGTTQAKGTWTPTIVGSTTDPTVTYTAQAGSWVRTGNFIHLEWMIIYSALSGGSGFVCVGGVPNFGTVDLVGGGQALRGHGWMTHPGGVPANYVGLMPFYLPSIKANAVGLQYETNTVAGFGTYPFASIATATGPQYISGAIDLIVE